MLFLILFTLPETVVGQTTHTIGWGTASGEAGTYTNFEDVLGTVTNVLFFSSQKNDSGSNPAYNSGSSELRLYYHSGGNGGSITITPATGITITGAVMTTSTTPSVSYYVNGSSAVPVAALNSTYTISNISATTSLKIQNVNTSNTQLRIKTIAITYTVSSNPSITAENVNINADATSGSITYQINNGTPGAIVSAAVLSGSTISNLAIDNDNITTTTVPFTCDANTENTAKTAMVRLTYGNVTKDVTISQARYVPQVSGYNIDFEYEPESYVDWTFTNMESKKTNSNVNAHGGSYFGDTGGKETASITTNETVANPGTLTCYVTKQSDNTTSSTWYIQVKTTAANATWTTVTSRSATDMKKGEWKEFTTDLSSYANVYVRVYYDGSTAVRNIDDLSLTMASTDPSISASDVDITYDATNGSIGCTINHAPTPAGTLTAAIAQSPASTIEGLTIGTINGLTVPFSCSANNTTTARTATVTLTYTYSDNQTTTKDVVITQAAHPTPSITASNVNIAGDATNGSIGYTIENSIDGGVLSASTVATWLTPGVVTNDAVSFTCEANQGAARSATVVLTYTYNTNQTVTKNVTVTQAKAPYTTIPAMFAGATSTSTEVDVTFGGWVVSGVSTNGKNVFITDNQGNGFVIYSSSDQSGTYAVGDILSGIASSCKLKLNNGYAQLTSVSGLTINTGGTVSVANIAMANLSGVNTGALVHYENLTGSSSSDNYYLSDGNTTIQIYGSLSTFTIEANKKYDITGIYQQFSNTKEVLPRSANDVVLKAQMTAPSFNAFTYVVGNTPTAQTAAIAGTDFSGNLTVSIAEGDYVVSNDGSTYGTSATFTKANNGSITSQTLYVKLNSGLSAGTYNGKLSFTADYLDAFDVDLEGSVTANPTYNVTLTQPTGDIATIAADPAYAQSGATITLSYSDVDDCYEFDSWSVMWEDTEMHEITPDANNQFEMPAAEVFVSATFTQKKFTVNYSVNGTVYDELVDEDIDCGDAAYMWDEDEMEDEGVTIPSGFEFAGWSTSAGSTETVASFEPTDNSTLYAVLVPTGGSSDYVKVTEDLEDWSGEYLIVNEDSAVAFDGSIDNNNHNATYDKTNGTISVSIVDVVATNEKKIVSTTTIDNSRFIVEKSGDVYTIKSAAGYYIGRTTNSTGVDSNYNTTTTDLTNTFDYDEENKIMTVKAGNDYILRYNSASDQNRFRYYSGTNVKAIQLYKKQTATPYTQVYTGNNNASANIIISGPTLITGSSVLNMGDHALTNDNPANLIIEDGAQLITTSTGVEATVKKNTLASTDATKDAAVNNWYAIASPINSGVIADFVQGTHNVYRYVEKSFYWNEYRSTVTDEELGLASFTNFENGRGYLYRSTTANVEYAGTVNASSVSYTLTAECTNDEFKGFNLIGNPFTHDIYKNDVYQSSGDNLPAINSDKLAVGYYRLGTDGTWTSTIGYNNPIKPGEAVMVKASDEFTLTIKNNNNPAAEYTPSSKSGLDNVIFTVANNQYQDVAYAMFNQGVGLNKIEHYNADAQMLYISQDDDKYSIAMMSDDTHVINLNFKAKTMGKYTLALKAYGNFSYMHLIDKLTGEDVDMLLEGEYSFMATPADNDSRFIVKLDYQPAEGGDNGTFAYQNGTDIFITGEGELQVFDVMGRFVNSYNVNVNKTISVSELNTGVYVFRLVGNEIHTQKIVVK